MLGRHTYRVAARLALWLAAAGAARAADAAELRVRLLPFSKAGKIELDPAGVKVRYEFDQSNVHHLQLVVRVEDAAGRPVRGLGYGQMSLVVDGKAAPLTAAEMRAAPAYLGRQGLRLALVIDRSASMYGAPLAECKARARALIQALQPGDKMAVISFSNMVETHGEFADDPAVLRLFVDALQPDMDHDGSVLADAVQKAVEAMPADADQKAILLLADGENQGSITTIDAAVRAAAAADCPVFALGVGQRRVNDEVLDQLASGSGGERLTLAIAPVEIMAKIRNALRPDYIVTVQTDKLPADGKSHVLALRVDAPAGAGQSEPASFVSGLEPTRVWAIAAVLLTLGLLVVISGLALFLAARRRSSQLRGEPRAGENAASLCPMCREPMPAGSAMCPSCGYEPGKVVSVDDVEP